VARGSLLTLLLALAVRWHVVAKGRIRTALGPESVASSASPVISFLVSVHAHQLTHHSSACLRACGDRLARCDALAITAAA